jgi:hypothetical protein
VIDLNRPAARPTQLGFVDQHAQRTSKQRQRLKSVVLLVESVGPTSQTQPDCLSKMPFFRHVLWSFVSS